MTAPPAPKCRLFAILARNAHQAVIFRRGPSRRVLCVLWHTDTDRFEEGQWLKGRIYERRADLSPSGDKLLYFAAKWERRDMTTWTALSKPPWLTALALWPKGDAWGGGGLFEWDRAISLNHPYGDIKLHPGSRLPPHTRVREMELASRGGEDFPLYHMRLERDGWKLVGHPGRSKPDFSNSPVWKFEPRWEYRRGQPGGNIELCMGILGIHERNGDWYVVEHRLVRNAEVLLDLGRTEWADWDKNGDLLFARDGVMYRLRRKSALDLDKSRELIDLRDRCFAPREAPRESAALVEGCSV